MPSTLYHSGPILTMEGTDPAYAEALVVSDGVIRHVGSRADAEALQPDRSVDLAGRALLPGFIDAHGHIVVAAHQSEQAWLRGPHITSVADIVDALKDVATANGVQPGEWIVGNGFDFTALAEGRPPTAAELDEVSTDNPVIAFHASAHTASVNHRALELAGYGPGCPDPDGGRIDRLEGTDEPSGYLEEAPVFVMRSLQAPIPADRYARVFAKAVDIWACNGFTSAQECCLGSGGPDDFDILMAAAQNGPLPVDVLVFAEPQHMPKAREVLAGRTESYVDGLRFGGLKLFLDGSMSGRTAWLSQPYCGLAGQPNDRGVARYSDVDLAALVDQYYPTGIQIQAHINGDAALDQFLGAIETAITTHGRRDARPVAIHLGQVRPEQWQRIGVIGLVPSLLAGTFREMSDIVAEYVGAERMSWHYPAASAVEYGVEFTSHNDAPLIPQSAMALLDGLVNRTSGSGTVHAPEQAVSVFEALRSITTAAAYQSFEEDHKGTLTVGKRADLVILDRDPLAVDPAELLSVRVVETIKDGRTIFAA
jgi:predicted amidohydrolase YtcJ